jgi:hypothetical protein
MIGVAAVLVLAEGLQQVLPFTKVRMYSYLPLYLPVERYCTYEVTNRVKLYMLRRLSRRYTTVNRTYVSIANYHTVCTIGDFIILGLLRVYSHREPCDTQLFNAYLTARAWV